MSLPAFAVRPLARIARALHGFHHQRSDRKIFVIGLTLFSAITLAAGLAGIGMVGHYDMAAYEESLWTAFRTNGDLFRTSVHTAVARSREIVQPSRLGPLVAAGAPDSAVREELGRIVDIADYGEVRSITVVDAHGRVRARVGAASYRDQFSVRLPVSIAHSAQLFWSDGWRLVMRIPLDGKAPEGAFATVEAGLYRFDRDVARLDAAGISSELRVCTADGQWMRCFPSRLLQQVSSFPMAPATHPQVMNHALGGKQGVVTQRDYRSKEVIAAYGRIESLGLGLVYKIDAEEAFQPIARKLGYGLAALLLLIGTGAGLIYWRMRPLVTGLALAHARLDAILANVPAGVVLLDSEDRVISANRAAHSLFRREDGGLDGVHAGQLLSGPDGSAGAVRSGMQELSLRRPGSGACPLQVTATDALPGLGSGRVLIIQDLTQRKRLEQELRQNEQLLRDLSAHMERVREEERKAIAREVHDELGQALTVLRMEVSLLRIHHGQDNPALLERIQSMKQEIDRTIHIVRHVSAALRPVALDLGLSAALAWLVEDFRTRTGIACRLHAGARDIVLDESKATALFRIAQESLTNVIKHAGATEVDVSLRMAKGQVRLEVRDNGTGFVPAAPARARTFGLAGMRERALILDGSVDIRSAPAQGTRVIVRLPLGDAATTKDHGDLQ